MDYKGYIEVEMNDDCLAQFYSNKDLWAGDLYENQYLLIKDSTGEVVDKYCEKTNTNPMEHYNDFIFNFQSKTAWIERDGNPIYSENDLDKWCEFLNKDLSDKRKEEIIKGFNKQKEYLSLGDYLYYEVEWTDVVKWHTNAYRNIFNKATEAVGITYSVSSHSLRKSFGYWIHQLHPFDPDCLISLSKLLNHATVQQTTVMQQQAAVLQVPAAVQTKAVRQAVPVL